MKRRRISSSSASSSSQRLTFITNRSHPHQIYLSLHAMDPRRSYALAALFILSVLSSHLKVICGDSSVVFLDNPSRSYLRHPPAQTTLSPAEVGAAASVLLGLAPPSTLSLTSSSKLNDVLMPNPFNRPRAVLMLEVTGAEDSELAFETEKLQLSRTLRFGIVGEEQRVDIQLPDEGEVSLISLDEVTSGAEYSDKELSVFASWLGGSYVEDASIPLNAELIFPMENDVPLRLQMSKNADREFVTSLVLLINNIRRTIDVHQVLTNSKHSPAELITGRFNGIKALQDHYGTEGIAQSGLKLFVTSISKAFDSFQAAYQGKIVGVIVHSGPRASESASMVHVRVTSRPSARGLEEAESSPELTKLAEIVFVRRTLAWITGIILLIATLLGIHFLLNMPITKDTLLYSNVKLD